MEVLVLVCSKLTPKLTLWESFTYMPLKKLPVTHMPWKSFHILVCHALKIR
jgi:hypothetical protein